MKKQNHYHSEWKTAGPANSLDRVAHELLKADYVIEVVY
jgi:hypothetical protein